MFLRVEGTINEITKLKHLGRLGFEERSGVHIGSSERTSVSPHISVHVDGMSLIRL